MKHRHIMCSLNVQHNWFTCSTHSTVSVQVLGKNEHLLPFTVAIFPDINLGWSNSVVEVGVLPTLKLQFGWLILIDLQ